MKFEAVQWSDEYELGLPEIDMQHEWLFALINRLWRQMVGQSDRAEVLRILADLERYTVSHFSAEEEFMRATQYPRFAAHRDAHIQFIDRIALERTQIGQGGHLSLGLVHFLQDWLIQHIRVADKAYASHFRQESRPVSLLGKLFRRFS